MNVMKCAELVKPWETLERMATHMERLMKEIARITSKQNENGGTNHTTTTFSKPSADSKLTEQQQVQQDFVSGQKRVMSLFDRAIAISEKSIGWVNVKVVQKMKAMALLIERHPPKFAMRLPKKGIFKFGYDNFFPKAKNEVKDK
jgi:thiamine biosynthesis lipoprotein ApbE